MLTHQDVGFFLKQAHKREDLSEWEEEFLINIEERYDAGEDLSEKQQEKLHEVAMRGNS